MTDIFISYSRTDKDFVQRLFDLLEQQGQDAWVDWDDIEYAEDWWQKIQRGIAEADNFVFIMSPHSVRSKVCFDEIQYAVDMHKRIIPVVIADIDDPADQERTHPALKQHNWLFFRPEDPFETTFATLLETVKRDPQYVHMHTRLLVNAQEWQSNDQNKSLLLRGDNLRQAETWLQTAQDKEPSATALHTEYIKQSHQIEKRNRRRSISITVGAIGILLALASIAFSLFQRGQRDDLERASIAQAAAALDSRDNGDIISALSQAIEANQIDDPPDEALAALRTVAGAPGPVAVFTNDSPVTAAALSPDQQYILAGYADGSLRLWAAAAGVGHYDIPLQHLSPDETAHSDRINALDFSPDGRYAASVGCAIRGPDAFEPNNDCMESAVLLWEIADNQVHLTYRLTEADYSDARISSSEAFDAEFRPTPRDPSTLELGIAFGVAQGPVVLTYHFNDSGVVNDLFFRAYDKDGGDWANGNIVLAFSPNSDEVVAGFKNGALYYWQGDPNNARNLNSFDDKVTAVMFNPASQSTNTHPIIAASTDGSFRKLLAANNNDPNEINLNFGDPVNALAYNPSGSHALVALESGELRLLDMNNNASTVGILHWQPNVAFTAIDYGTTLMGDSQTVYAVSGSADGTLILWDTGSSLLSTDEFPDKQTLLTWVAEKRYTTDLTD